MKDQKKLEEYARLLVEIGVNLQKGQRLMINAPVDCAGFVRLCASAAYDAGCAEVIVNWSDDYLAREKYLRGADSVFETFPSWKREQLMELADEGVPKLAIYASDPESMKGVDPERLLKWERVSGAAMEDYRNMQMRNDFPWCVASIPITPWAKKVSPELSDDEAVDALWEKIFAALRIDGSGNAVERWREHIGTLAARCEKLTSLAFKKLHYTNSAGTDLTIELPENHIWLGGSEKTTGGRVFVANMPTEEVFTAPKRDGVNGRVVASMPLVKDGNVIEGIVMDFKDGKIVSAYAKTNEDILKAAIAVDEGASYLGEVALVPYKSPISDMKTLFYNTLFDENASCHLAFGDSYPCVKGGAEMTREQLSAAGLNSSVTHEDFMVGTADLSIVGVTADGTEIPVFVDGNFAI